MTHVFHTFPDDIPRTETLYGQPDGAPVAVAVRGRHPLGHQCQMIRRDLFAEQIPSYMAHGGLRVSETSAEYRERMNTPYRYLVQGYGGTPCTAFRTAEGLEAWREAYGLEIDEQGKVVFGAAPLQELGWVPAPSQGFLPEAVDGAMVFRAPPRQPEPDGPGF